MRSLRSDQRCPVGRQRTPQSARPTAEPCRPSYPSRFAWHRGWTRHTPPPPPARPSPSRGVLSQLPVTIRVPSGLNAALTTAAVCLLSTFSWLPVDASHTRAVRSQLPLTNAAPVESKLTVGTGWPVS